MLVNEILYQEELMKNNPDNLFYYAGVIDALESGDKGYKEILDLREESKQNIEKMQDDIDLFKDEIAYYKGLISGCGKALDIDWFIFRNSEMSFDIFVYCEDEMICSILNASFTGDKSFSKNVNSGLKYAIFSDPEKLVSAIKETDNGFRSVTVIGVDKQLPSVETMNLISTALNDNKAMFLTYVSGNDVLNADELVHKILKAHKV